MLNETVKVKEEEVFPISAGWIPNEDRIQLSAQVEISSYLAYLDGHYYQLYQHFN